MLRLFWRKFILILILIPVLNVTGYFYALVHPRLLNRSGGEHTINFWESYRIYLGSVFQGEFGQVGRETVRTIIQKPIQNSLILVAIALVVTIVFGVVLGLLSISPRTRRISPVSFTLLSAGSSLPGFLFGGVALALIVYQTLYAGRSQSFLPISGYGLDEHLILPVLVLAIQPTMYIAKVTAVLLENELQQDYIQVARSKGLSWMQLLWQHALPNMMAPILLTIGESMRLMVGALIIVEAIFIWPGIGRIFLQTVGLRLDGRPASAYFANPPLLAALTVLLGGLLLLADLIATLISSAVDPRLAVEGA